MTTYIKPDVNDLDDKIRELEEQLRYADDDVNDKIRELEEQLGETARGCDSCVAMHDRISRLEEKLDRMLDTVGKAAAKPPPNESGDSKPKTDKARSRLLPAAFSRKHIAKRFKRKPRAATGAKAERTISGPAWVICTALAAALISAILFSPLVAGLLTMGVVLAAILIIRPKRTQPAGAPKAPTSPAFPAAKIGHGRASGKSWRELKKSGRKRGPDMPRGSGGIAKTMIAVALAMTTILLILKHVNSSLYNDDD